MARGGGGPSLGRGTTTPSKSLEGALTLSLGACCGVGPPHRAAPAVMTPTQMPSSSFALEVSPFLLGHLSEKLMFGLFCPFAALSPDAWGCLLPVRTGLPSASGGREEAWKTPQLGPTPSTVCFVMEPVQAKALSERSGKLLGSHLNGA